MLPLGHCDTAIYVCVCVCVSVSPQGYLQNYVHDLLPKFLCIFPIAVPWSCSGGMIKTHEILRGGKGEIWDFSPLPVHCLA